MNQGMQGVRQAKAEMDERKAAGAALYGTPRFSLRSGEAANVRFLHQGDQVVWAWMHTLPKTGNQQFGDRTPCLDQSGQNAALCPFCSAGEKRTFQGFMPLIWRNGPVYRKDANGYRVKDNAGNYIQESYADQVALWTAGIQVFDTLDGLDVQMGGLTSRDMTVRRSGTGLATTYSILPADMNSGPQPWTQADIDLVAANPIDMSVFIKPMAYEELAAKLGAVQAQAAAAPRQAAPAPSGVMNPFTQPRQ